MKKKKKKSKLVLNREILPLVTGVKDCPMLLNTNPKITLEKFYRDLI